MDNVSSLHDPKDDSLHPFTSSGFALIIEIKMVSIEASRSPTQARIRTKSAEFQQCSFCVHSDHVPGPVLHHCLSLPD